MVRGTTISHFEVISAEVLRFPQKCLPVNGIHTALARALIIENLLYLRIFENYAVFRDPIRMHRYTITRANTGISYYRRTPTKISSRSRTRRSLTAQTLNCPESRARQGRHVMAVTDICDPRRLVCKLVKAFRHETGSGRKISSRYVRRIASEALSASSLGRRCPSKSPCAMRREDMRPQRGFASRPVVAVRHATESGRTISSRCV